MDFLQKFEIFKHLSSTQLNSLTYGMVEETFVKNQTVYTESVD
jgi:hypothetical protein